MQCVEVQLDKKLFFFDNIVVCLFFDNEVVGKIK